MKATDRVREVTCRMLGVSYLGYSPGRWFTPGQRVLVIDQDDKVVEVAQVGENGGLSHPFMVDPRDIEQCTRPLA